MYLDPQHRSTMLRELRAIAQPLNLSNLSKLFLFAQALNEQQQGKSIARAKDRARRQSRTFMKSTFLGQTVTVCKLEGQQALITVSGYDRTFVKMSDLEIEKPLDASASESGASLEKKETGQRSGRQGGV